MKMNAWLSDSLIDRVRRIVTAWTITQGRSWLAEEITSEALLYLVERAHQFIPGPASIETWAVAIVKGFLSNRWRLTVWRDEESTPSISLPVSRQNGKQSTLGTEAEKRRARRPRPRNEPTLPEILAGALSTDQISPTDFVLLSCEGRGYSRGHLAESLKLTDDSIRQRKSRSVRSIKKYIHGSCSDDTHPEFPVSLSPSPDELDPSWLAYLRECQLSAVTQTCKTATGHAEYMERAEFNRKWPAGESGRGTQQEKLAA